MTDPVLSIRDLSVAFISGGQEVTAVDNVSIDVDSGQTVAVVGESGSGKSTTAAAINRLLPVGGRVTGGGVWFEGADLAALSRRQMGKIRGAGIGLVPQDPMSNLNPLMRIGDQVAEALEVHDRAHGKAARARAIELLDMVGITDPTRGRQYPHEFSGGMRQRALIAMGLACQPRLLIADEPTSALDVTLQRRILDQLAELTAEMGTSVFLITHDLALAAERADRVEVMYRGQIVESGSAETILRDPRHEYTKRLLAAAPSLTSVSTVSGTVLAPVESTGGDEKLRVEGLTKRFELRGWPADTLTAVDDVSFTLRRGQTVSIVGESGSGKSTTANLVLGLEAATAGSIHFDGHEIPKRKRYAERMAFYRQVQPVFQNPYASLNPRYTVEKVIAEPLRVHGVGNKRSRSDNVRELLEQVALPTDMAQRLPHELSGGQRQRVAIARAIALSPDLVVLDEAVSALDVLVQAQILELLAQLQRDLGLSYLFISHDLAVVKMISHEVHVMREGKIVESGAPRDIFDNPRHDYTKELLAAIPGTAIQL